MSNLLFIFLIYFFSLIIFSCSSDDGSKSADSTTTDNDSTTTTDTTSPRLVSITPTDGVTSVPITSSISITFSEPMNTSSLTVNTLDNVCFGTFQIGPSSARICFDYEYV